MPAVTVEDLSVIDRVAQVNGTQRRVKSLTTGPAGFEGEGFPVRRAFAGLSLADIDPFVHMDQMGEIEYAAGEPKGTPWHPHRGFETVTYIIDGTFLHQDSHGGGGVITDGGTQWMTAGSGILHIETPPEEMVIKGGLFHGVQLWVNLAPKDKMLSPAYQNLEADMVRLVASADGASLVRVIAGELPSGADGHGAIRGPGSTHSPMALVHASIPSDSRLELPWDPEFNAIAYVLAGSGVVGNGNEDVPLRAGQTVLFGGGDWISLGGSPNKVDASEALEVMIMGGRPIGAPVVTHGPFVMNTREEIQQAVTDYQAGRLGVVPPGALQPYRVR